MQFLLPSLFHFYWKVHCSNWLLPSWIKCPVLSCALLWVVSTCPYCNPLFLGLASKAFNPRQEQYSAEKKEKLLPLQMSVVTFHLKMNQSFLILSTVTLNILSNVFSLMCSKKISFHKRFDSSKLIWSQCSWIFFLSAFLQNCFLCWDCWNSDVSPTLRDSGNDFCRFSFLGYPKRNDFVPSWSQKKRPGTTVV